MNSKITEATYQEIISHDYTKESNFILRNFYITNKQGNAYIKKNQGQFFFSWSPCKENTYINWCKSDNILYRVNVCFSNFDEMNKKLEVQYFCPYHSYCRERCSANRITSPEDKCAICLKYVQIHMLEETACEHRFCLSCLDKYVKNKLLPEGGLKDNCILCPVCRRNLVFCNICVNAKYECTCDVNV